ncbi:MAG: RNA 3'-terminal phosphate cyclase [candidate division WOR-3 bacterium]|nr:RNA 3'-terminal phosphate cyclase [candidate division WOR-3 bacterium]MDW8113454.1 RNA 3'-terminal phosphate cyclase [candidate division WOR-3 bacterium]
MIIIDGSYGEGGGQILRTSLSLSACFKKPFFINNIRKGRKKPGILPQHLTGINAAAKICEATVENNKLYSLSLKFIPKTIIGGEYYFNVAEEKRSAGSITLVIQAILPILFFASQPSKVILEGGTHVPFSPIFDYLENILIATIKKFSFFCNARIEKYGFYPIGGGKVSLEVEPFKKGNKNTIEFLERGKLEKIKIISKVGKLNKSIAQRQVEKAYQILKNFNPEILIEEIESASPGTYTFIMAQFENIVAGFSSLGEIGKPAEKVAEEAAEEFLEYYQSNGVVDYYLADQLPIFIILSNTVCRYKTNKITNHLRTNLWVIKNFLPEKKIFLNEEEKLIEIY